MLLINARNSHVKEGLQRAYSSKVTGGRLKVFCVSNTTYEKFCKKGNTEMVQASGIPDLRRFCHTITADAQLLQARHFLQSTLSSLLNSVELWANRSREPPKIKMIVPAQSIYDNLNESKREVRRIPYIPLRSADTERLLWPSTSSKKISRKHFESSFLNFWVCLARFSRFGGF